MELALWYAYACNNLDEYRFYYRAAQWMPSLASSGRGGAERCLVLPLRLRLDVLRSSGRARKLRRPALLWIRNTPGGWLEVGKLQGPIFRTRRVLWMRSGGASPWCQATMSSPPSAVKLRRVAGFCEEMEFHWIDPDCDSRLQSGEMDAAESDKRLSVSGICCDRSNLAALKEALHLTDWEADAHTVPVQSPIKAGR
ncbi:MAG: hypothetical protein V8R75_14285 [Oscillospiraceae bacterium]